MAKAAKKTAPKKVAKPRAETYEKPVIFDGTFDDMINISLTGAGAKKKEEKEVAPIIVKNSGGKGG